MSAERVATLTTLLDQALRCLEVRASPSAEQWSVDQFVRIWRLCHLSYLPQVYLQALSHTLRVRDADIRRDVLELLRDDLSAFLRDGRIFPSGILALGGGLPGDGLTIEELLGALLRAAISAGSRNAALRFYECTTENKGHFQEVAMLSGVQLEAPLEVFSGCTIRPLPPSPSRYPPSFTMLLMEYDLEPYGQAFVTTDRAVSPAFVQPPERIGDHGKADIEARIPEFPDFNLIQLCQALSLACKSAIAPTLRWVYIPGSEVFNIHTLPSLQFYAYVPIHPSRLQQPRKATIEFGHMEEAKAIYRGLDGLGTEDKRGLQIPIDRWIQSKASQSLVDCVIDLGIALEALYLKDQGSELSFRLRTTAAWHLGSDKEDRKALAQQFKAVYDLRSQAVHSGRLPDTVRVGTDRVRTRAFVATAQDLCRKSLRRVIDDGRLPDGSDLVLGDG